MEAGYVCTIDQRKVTLWTGAQGVNETTEAIMKYGADVEQKAQSYLVN